MLVEAEATHLAASCVTSNLGGGACWCMCTRKGYTGEKHLYEATNGFAISGNNVLVVGVHNLVALCPGVQVLGHVQVDLVSIKVGVERGTIGVVHPDGPLTLQSLTSQLD